MLNGNSSKWSPSIFKFLVFKGLTWKIDGGVKANCVNSVYYVELREEKAQVIFFFLFSFNFKEFYL